MKTCARLSGCFTAVPYLQGREHPLLLKGNTSPPMRSNPCKPSGGLSIRYTTLPGPGVVLCPLWRRSSFLVVPPVQVPSSSTERPNTVSMTDFFQASTYSTVSHLRQLPHLFFLLFFTEFFYIFLACSSSNYALPLLAISFFLFSFLHSERVTRAR